MNSVPISNCTRRIGAPKDWDHEKDGICHTIEVSDSKDEHGLLWMGSCWMPSPEELERIKNGVPITLFICGTVHPVVSLVVGEP